MFISFPSEGAASEESCQRNRKSAAFRFLEGQEMIRIAVWYDKGRRKPTAFA